MRLTKRFAVPLFFLIFAIPHVHALETGKAPPPFVPMKWFNGKGADPSRPDGKHVYIVEFWTSNSSACRQMVPVLNRLHRQYQQQGLVVMGISSEKPETLALFMADAPMAYPVAFDPGGKSSKAFMGNTVALPYAYIVSRKGLVIWQGTPLPRLEEVIGQVMAGTFDLEQEARVLKLENSIRKLAQKGKVEQVIAILDQLSSLRPKVHRYYGFKARLMVITGKKAKVKAVFAAWAKGCANSAAGLGALADTLAQNQDQDLRDPKLALQYAKKALVLSQGKDLRAYITLAKIYAQLGLFQKAITTLQQGRKAPGFKESETIAGLQNYYRKLRAAQEQAK